MSVARWSGPEAASMLDRDQRFVGADFELLHGPGVAVRVAEAEERAAVAWVEHGDLAAFHAAVEQLASCRFRVRDHELQAAYRTGRHVALGGQVAEYDRTARAVRGQLDDMHLFSPCVVIELEADLVTVELGRMVDVADGQDHNLKGPVHGPLA